MRRAPRELRRACASRAAVLILGLAACLAAYSPASAERLEITLAQAIDMALEGNRELGIIRAEERAARARLGQARAGFFPRLSASGSYTRLDEAPYMDASQFGDIFAPLMVPFQELVANEYLSEGSLAGLQGGGADRIYLGDDDIYSIGVSVEQPLFTGGALLSGYGAASRAAEAAAWNARRAEDVTRYEVTQAYTGLVVAEAALDVMEDAVEQMRSHLSDIEAMHGEGMVLESDLMSARVRMSEVELERNSAEHGVRLAQAALAFALGISVDTEITPVDRLDPAGAPSRDESAWVETAIGNRPDLHAMSQAAHAAENAVGIARSGYFPQLVLIGNYNWDRPNREYEPEFYDHWSVTVALQMNIFDWGLTGNRVQEAKAGRLQAENGLALLEEAVRLEVRQSLLEHDEATAAVAIAKAGLAQARESMRIARESFRSGVATNSDVLDAQTAETAAEMSRLAAMARLKSAEAKLELATGIDSR
jgi:outer membrane protein TolC